jgi:hypothetical protein
VSLTAQQLADAMAVAARDTFRPPPPWAYSSFMRSSAPSKPTTTPTTEIVRTPAYEAPVASEVVLDPAPEHTEVVPTWQALLDLRVWRTRPWWLRVAASLVVRRRNDLRR